MNSRLIARIILKLLFIGMLPLVSNYDWPPQNLYTLLILRVDMLEPIQQGGTCQWNIRGIYSEPRSEPQTIVIPDPLDGVYRIRLIGTKTENYTFIVELITLENRTTDTYTDNIVAGQILEI